MLRDSEVSVMVDCRARPGIGVWEAISGAIAFAVRNQCGVRLLWGNHLLEIGPRILRPPCSGGMMVSGVAIRSYSRLPARPETTVASRLPSRRRDHEQATVTRMSSRGIVGRVIQAALGTCRGRSDAWHRHRRAGSPKVDACPESDIEAEQARRAVGCERSFAWGERWNRPGHPLTRTYCVVP
jgi:hypothetical protein